MVDEYTVTRRNFNPQEIYKKYKEGDYILTNIFTKRNSYLVKIYKVNSQNSVPEYPNVITSISSILVKIPNFSLKAGLLKDVKDVFKRFIKNNCYHREFCLCEKEELYKNKCKKCNGLIYNNIELKKKNRIINKFSRVKSFSRPFPLSFSNELTVESIMGIEQNISSLYDYVKSMIRIKKMKEINTSTNYFVKLTPEEYRCYIRKYLSIKQFYLFLFSQKNSFYLPYGINRLIYSFC